MITGPRQAGKTTLVRHLAGDAFRYASLDDPDVRAAALADPRGFLDSFPPPVVFDEVQRVPEIFPYITAAFPLSSTPTPRFGDEIRDLTATLPTETLTPGYVVTPGASELPMGPEVRALPFAKL